MKWSQEKVDAYQAEFEAKMKRYAGFTQDELADTFQPDEGPESSLQRKAEAWLQDHCFPYVHDRSKKKNRSGAILDLHIYLPQGRHVVVEFKAKGNKMSDDQKETFRRIKFLGHEIYEVRSFKQFLSIMKGEKDD